MPKENNDVDQTGVQDNKIYLTEEQMAIVKASKSKPRVAQYPKEFQALVCALHATGYSEREIAGRLGVSKGTVHNWIHSSDIEDNYGLQQLNGQTKRNLAQRQYRLSSHILGAISEEDVKKASLLQKTTASSQLIDKARLLDGEATEVIDHVYKKQGQTKKHINEFDSDIIDIQAKMKDLEQE